MENSILWAALGGFVATMFNIFYNYVREAINRRWQVATEIAGAIDYYYERVVRLVAHQEGVNDDKTPMLTQDEFRKLAFEVSPVLVDAQQSKTRMALVFGENSREIQELEELIQLIKTTIDTGLSVTRSGWVKEGPELKQRINEINDKRHELRKLLVRQSRLWAVLRESVCKDRKKFNKQA